MRAGQLDRRITIERKTGARDPKYGTQADQWEPVFARIPAQVKDELPSKSEKVSSGVRTTSAPARIRIRYMSGITAEMRIVVHDQVERVMEIVGAPAEIGRREWLEFVATEVTK